MFQTVRTLRVSSQQQVLSSLSQMMRTMNTAGALQMQSVLMESNKLKNFTRMHGFCQMQAYIQMLIGNCLYKLNYSDLTATWYLGKSETMLFSVLINWVLGEFKLFRRNLKVKMLNCKQIRSYFSQ